jgi:hypothetical protein
MFRSLVVLTLALAVAACGDAKDPYGSGKPSEGPPPPPSGKPPHVVAAPIAGGSALEGAAGARATVDSYLLAAKRVDEAGMLALGTAEFQKTEKTWKKAFTLNIVKGGFALKSYEVREPEVSGDTANVSVGATFVVDGKDDPEGMRFTLTRRDGKWWITEIH